MKTAVVLCAGAGTKVWPYNKIRNKVMIPVSNIPIVAHSVNSLTEMGFEKIIIVGGSFAEEIRNYFRDFKNVEIIVDGAPKGTAFSLLKAREAVGNENFLALYGDTIVDTADLQKLVSSFEATGEATALVDEIRFDKAHDHVGCLLDDDGEIDGIFGHSHESTHFFAGFAFSPDVFELLAANSGRFTEVEVGMMPHIEGYIEMTVSDMLKAGKKVNIVNADSRVFDIDKPWHIVDASVEINKKRCRALTKNEIGEGTVIDPTASIGGFIKTGKNCIIGKNVIIEGNIIIGDNTKILNGAIVQGGVVIGSLCSVRNACFVAEGSTIGDECIVSHAAELEGVIFKRVYLYHYMEFYGVIGENTDLGAATVCGTLRFDSFPSIQHCKGRREFPQNYSDCTFLGDYCRTGVNTIFMPGVKVGAYSVVGAGVILNQDVPDNTLIYTKQELVQKPWSSDVYGW